MKGKSPNQDQGNLFLTTLKDIVNPNHELVVLSQRIDWQELEDEFSPLYSHTGQPGMPIRMMVGWVVIVKTDLQPGR